MRLATVRTPGGTAAARVEGREGVLIDGFSDVGDLLNRPGWRTLAEHAAGPRVSVDHLATVIPQPGKIICVGLNYRAHILEMGRPLPEYPTLFAKFTDALIG
ncbi:MAG TPA: 2-hydroxyhepta-2,4-diene-1,7-dioate isomerase, partial [Microlunatus sp.]|nr:2-hydroxyhepta-2,4-diene-1,7-dioate isomerase [Microlunatus sp.]